MNISAGAALLAEHRLNGRAFAGFPPDIRPRNEEDAYLLQEALHERLVAAGRGPLAGWKIGCTTPVMQAYLSIHNPSGGGLFAATVQPSGAHVPHKDFLRVGVECELAIRLGADLDSRSHPIDSERIKKSLAAVMAAIEIVEDRYVNYPALDAYTLIADDFFGAGCVLGEEHDPAGLELESVSARMLVEGHEVGRGVGADILGRPLAALEWLATLRDRMGHPLRAGETVLLGSLVQTNWVEPGQTVRVENDPLGVVTVTF